MIVMNNQPLDLTNLTQTILEVMKNHLNETDNTITLYNLRQAVNIGSNQWSLGQVMLGVVSLRSEGIIDTRVMGDKRSERETHVFKGVNFVDRGMESSVFNW